jgi:hypothetical protein
VEATSLLPRTETTQALGYKETHRDIALIDRTDEACRASFLIFCVAMSITTEETIGMRRVALRNGPSMPDQGGWKFLNLLVAARSLFHIADDRSHSLDPISAYI